MTTDTHYLRGILFLSITSDLEHGVLWLRRGSPFALPSPRLFRRLVDPRRIQRYALLFIPRSRAGAICVCPSRCGALSPETTVEERADEHRYEHYDECHSASIIVCYNKTHQ